VVIALSVLAAVFYLAGGWYFSGQIYSSGLKVDPSSVTLDLRVDSIGPGTITLRERAGHDDALRSDMVYGLKWETGFGQVSGAPSGTGAVVTRTFTLLTGTAPNPGDAAGLSRDAYPDDPAVALGRPVEEVSYASPLGAMPAWYVPGTSSTWAVLVHGWTASRTEMLRMMRTTVRVGLPSLDISYRNDAGAPADPSHTYQFGRTEWRDLEAAVEYARAHGAQAVVLVGASMGGALVAAFMQHSSEAHLVSALVLDAPMLSFSRVVDLAASQKSLPVLGVALPSSLTWVAKQFAALRYDLDWSALDYVRDTRWDRKPTLLLHGDADTRVPISVSKILAGEASGYVRFVVTRGAGHLESWNTNPTRYDRLLAEFLNHHT
jgi:pimeloyl-ACP methyl ester carboxylesterase